MKNIKKLVTNQTGSALIMTIVLTVLLAAVAVMFVAVARMDKASTSNIADNKALDSAAKSIIEIINRQLVYTVPGVAKQAKLDPLVYPQFFDYRDYPDVNRPWLASTEPYLKSGTSDYYWHQISDVTGYLSKIKKYSVRNVKVKPVGLNKNNSFKVVRQYPIFGMDPNGNFLIGDTKDPALDGVSADADGDGIADSKWFELQNMRTSTGRVFAAVRIIDNSSMVNINTAYQLNTKSPDANAVNGSSQTQINLRALLKGTTGTTEKIEDLQNFRSNGKSISTYEKQYIWDFNNFPENHFTPFDIADELELRYRFCINSLNTSRFEDKFPKTIKTYGDPGGLYDGSTNWSMNDWQDRIAGLILTDTQSDHRHLLTTINCDRIIDPNGFKMSNINTILTRELFNLFRLTKVNGNQLIDDANAAQMAVNIRDYRDTDSDVNALTVNIPGIGDKTFYGFEGPCAYISEIAYNQRTVSGDTPPEHKSYAIEFYKPYSTDSSPGSKSKWYIYIDKKSGSPSHSEIEIKDWSDSSQYYVYRLNDSNAPLDMDPPCAFTDKKDNNQAIFDNGAQIFLVRIAEDGNSTVVDEKTVPLNFIPAVDGIRSVERDISNNRCIMRFWTPPMSGSHSLGKAVYNTNTTNVLVAHPSDRDFNNVGQIGLVFKKPAYYKYQGGTQFGVIGYASDCNKEPQVRINLAADANVYPVFNYITAMKTPRAEETRVKGRININTAPASVLSQLPWLGIHRDGSGNDVNDISLANAIVAYRDKFNVLSAPSDYTTRTDPCGFSNIGQLNKVVKGNLLDRIDFYVDGRDQVGYPDIDPSDGVKDDFKERDLIFDRISDLITVRSDVFTAYILVRVGTNGPQKRYIAILDRSEVKKPTDKPILRAFQYVPDAR